MLFYSIRASIKHSYGGHIFVTRQARINKCDTRIFQTNTLHLKHDECHSSKSFDHSDHSSSVSDALFIQTSTGFNAFTLGGGLNEVYIEILACRLN